MPWQRYVADVACELDPEHPGEWWYHTVMVSVPRQAGKSDLVGAIHLHRMLAFADHRARDDGADRERCRQEMAVLC